jgi:hypothetical protein
MNPKFWFFFIRADDLKCLRLCVRIYCPLDPDCSLEASEAQASDIKIKELDMPSQRDIGASSSGLSMSRSIFLPTLMLGRRRPSRPDATHPLRLAAVVLPPPRAPSHAARSRPSRASPSQPSQVRCWWRWYSRGAVGAGASLRPSHTLLGPSRRAPLA